MNSTGLATALRNEIARRAAAWEKHIAQASGEDRLRRLNQAESDMLLWLMLAHELAWGASDQVLEPITVGQPLSGRLRTADLPLYPEGDEDWQRMERSVQATWLAAIGAVDTSPTPERRETLRQILMIRAAIRSRLTARAARRRARPAQQEAA